MSVRQLGVMMIACGLLVSAPWVRADEILFSGIPMNGVEIRTITEGQVVYVAAGQRTRRPIKNLIIHLDDVPALETAEATLRDGPKPEAIALFHKALAQADEPWQRAWINARLVTIYDADGRYTQAVLAWSRLLTDQPETYWASLMPSSKPDTPVKKQVTQAIKALSKVLEETSPGLLTDTVQATLDTLRALEPSAPDIEPADEFESVDEQNDTPEPSREETPEDDQKTSPPVVRDPERQPVPTLPAPKHEPEAHTASPSDFGLDEFIAAGDTAAARPIVEQLAAAPGDYPLDRLLFQYGQVLKLQSQPRDAAIRYLQCVILYPQSPYAARSAYETGLLYLGPLDDAHAARRLFRRALGIATVQDLSSIKQQAAAQLQRLEGRP